MGTWGVGLYQDDEAEDLRDTIAVLAKLPVDGTRLLDLLVTEDREANPDEDPRPAFWLVVADQFERRGIRCTAAQERALEVIDRGDDLRDLEARELSAAGLRQRAKALEALKARLLSPRPERPRPRASRPPPICVAAGDVIVHPSMEGESMNPHSGREDIRPFGGPFIPDGWGAIVILETGRAYDWFPWCSYQSLALWTESPPDLDEVRAGRLTSLSARRAVPNPRQLRRVGARIIGRLALSRSRVSAIPVLHVDKPVSPEQVVRWGWSVDGWTKAAPAFGAIRVADLLAD
jgi:hypothetical protein